MPSLKDTKEFYARDRAAWRDWLSKNYDVEQSIWLVYDKGKDRKISYNDIVEEVLCFGWIDATAGTVDDRKSKIYVTKRKPKSGWSKTNKIRLEHLIPSGKMHAAGLEAIRIAKENGSWESLDLIEDLVMPELLSKALAKNKKAAEHFEAFSNSSKKIIYQWIYTAKRDETIANRVNKTVELAEQGLKANQ